MNIQDKCREIVRGYEKILTYDFNTQNKSESSASLTIVAINTILSILAISFGDNPFVVAKMPLALLVIFFFWSLLTIVFNIRADALTLLAPRTALLSLWLLAFCITYLAINLTNLPSILVLGVSVLFTFCLQIIHMTKNKFTKYKTICYAASLQISMLLFYAFSTGLFF